MMNPAKLLRVAVKMGIIGLMLLVNVCNIIKIRIGYCFIAKGVVKKSAPFAFQLDQNLGFSAK